MGKTRIEVSPNLTSTLIFFRTLSFYDEKEKKRKIKKSMASSRKIAEQTVRSKNTVNKDINELKKNEIVIDASKEWYYVADIAKEQSSIELPQEFLTQMNRTFHQDYIKVYNWLYRELIHYHQPLFSCKRIVEQALGLTYNKDRVDKVNEILYQLALNGLIVIADVKVKTQVNSRTTFMWKLLEIRTEFRTIEMVKNIVNQQLQGADDFVGDELLLNESDYEVGTTIGFTERMLEQASENEFLLEGLPMLSTEPSNRTKLQDYVPIEELVGKRRISLEDALEELYNINPECNEAYYEYEMQRLSEK